MNSQSTPARVRSYFAPRVKLPPTPVALSLLARLSVAIIAVAVTTFLKMRLVGVFGDSAPFLLYFGAVAFSAWLGGWSAGFEATTFSAFARTGLFHGNPNFNAHVLAQAALFVVEGTGISLLIQGTRHSHSQSMRRARELQISEDRYRQVLDTAFEGIWIVDAQGATTYANEHLAAMIGYTRDRDARRAGIQFHFHRAARNRPGQTGKTPLRFARTV